MLSLVVSLAIGASAAADIRVQDIAHLQGKHANRLFGFGLVVGLDGTGDGAASPSTLRALMQLHRAYHAPVFDVEELKANKSVAIVSVEATIPEYGAREGQHLDVVVSTLGSAKSLKGGQLLITPLQESTLAVPDVFALAGGRLEIDETAGPVRGIVRNGAVLEADFFYNFVENGCISLVLDESKAGFQWADMLARSVNHALQSYARTSDEMRDGGRHRIAREPLAVAIGPTTVRVRMPEYYSDRPAQFISSVLMARITEEPQQRARVVINPRTKAITFSGTVTIAPTVVTLPDAGVVKIGQAGGGSPTTGLDTEKVGGVEFDELLATLTKLQLSPDQVIEIVQQLHSSGDLHAQLLYTE